MVERAFVTAMGRRIGFARAGAGAEAVVLVHASGLSSSAWRAYLEPLAARFLVAAPDLLGYGASDPLPRGEHVTHAEDVAAVRAIVEALGAPAHLVGHSYGAVVAAKAALAEPQRVRSVMLLEPVLFSALAASGDEPSRAEREALESGAFRDPETGGKTDWLRVFIDYWSGAGTFDAMTETQRRAAERVGWKTFQEVMDVSGDPAPFAAYAALPRPVTLGRGERTTVSARRILEHLHAVIPDATMRVVEGAGHMAPLTHKDAVLALIEEHLQGASRRR